MDVVRTDAGYVSGTVQGDPEKKIHVYRGIPYAAPPIGDLRWKPPQPVASWLGIRECTAFSAIAPQALSTMTAGMSLNEDCLYLNVLSPAERVSDKLPVMVQMHTAGFIGGSVNDEMSNALGLPSNGVVLVNINMRLGPLGCLAHPLLSKESPKGISGNYLFLDMIAALKWVQKNISAFGGDPNNVTIFGESGGAAKVINLMASPLAKGLFHKAIGQSGPLGGTLLKESEARGTKLFAKLGVDGEKDPLAAARALPWQKIIEAGIALTSELNIPGGPWGSTVDRWFLMDTAAGIFKAGKQNGVPFIVGANLGELTGPGTIVLPQLIPTYLNLFAGANKLGGKAYAYIFDQVPDGWKKDGVVSTHGMELGYVFGHFDYKGSDWLWKVQYSFAKLSGAKSADPGFTDADARVSEAMMKMWTNFAKTGDPSIKEIVEWPDYQEATDQYLYITESLQVKSGFSCVVGK